MFELILSVFVGIMAAGYITLHKSIENTKNSYPNSKPDNSKKLAMGMLGILALAGFLLIAINTMVRVPLGPDRPSKGIVEVLLFEDGGG